MNNDAVDTICITALAIAALIHSGLIAGIAFWLGGLVLLATVRAIQ